MRNLTKIFQTMIVLNTALFAAIAFADGPTLDSSKTHVRPQLKIHVEPFGDSDERAITLQFPSNTKTDSIRVYLNGKEVTAQFERSSCDNGLCEEGSVSTADGLLALKNVLSAQGKLDNGSLVSSRVRFAGDENLIRQVTRASRQRMKSGGMLTDTSTQTFPSGSSFIPSEVAIHSLGDGGVTSGEAWIQLGTQSQFSTASGCNSRYSVVVLDRNTLTQKTGAPESSPQCFDSGIALKSYLQGLSSSDLVIAGTNFYHNTDADAGAFALDTTPIGGKGYNADDNSIQLDPVIYSADIPLGYVIIGVPNSAPGSAYENYYTSSDAGQAHPSFNGMLIEDSNGNYNFTPAGAVEYYTTPNDPAYDTLSTFTLVNSPGLGKVVYASPNFGNVGGYWLLKLNRTNLISSPANCPTTKMGSYILSQPCGTFFPTGSNDPATSVQAFTNLAIALKSVKRDELVVLESWGNPMAATNLTDAANWFYRDSNGALYTPYYQNFGPALEAFGVPSMSTWPVNGGTQAYSLVSCLGCGDVLTGNAAWSSTQNSQQGETGVMHGLLQPDRQGLYRSTHAAQITPGKDSADYSLDILNSQPPTEWPELSLTLLPGASSVAGQVAAYRYASYQLVTKYYILESSGGYLDDIHYFFTGEHNAKLSITTFDPTKLKFPGSANGGYSWVDPVTNTTQSNFTQQDLTAVTVQLKSELIALSNVIDFLDNMQEVATAGSSNTILALVNAASMVQTSTLAPPPSTPTTLNVSNVLGLSSNIVNVVGTVGSVIAPETGPAMSVLSALIGGASSVDAGLTSAGFTAVPNRDAKIQSTIGDLASGSIQTNLNSAFTTESDEILSDWNKLGQIGPRTVDTNDHAYDPQDKKYQSAEETVLGQAAQRSFYMAILPTAFDVHFYPGLPAGDPGIGQWGTDSWGTSWCSAWYLGSGNPFYFTTPLVAGEPLTQSLGRYYTSNDLYMMAGAVQNQGAKNQTFQTASTELGNALTQQLNIPQSDLFFRNGPFKGRFFDVTSSSSFTNFPSSDWRMCQ